jgi:hypothetical protein
LGAQRKLPWRAGTGGSYRRSGVLQRAFLSANAPRETSKTYQVVGEAKCVDKTVCQVRPWEVKHVITHVITTGHAGHMVAHVFLGISRLSRAPCQWTPGSRLLKLTLLRRIKISSGQNHAPRTTYSHTINMSFLMPCSSGHLARPFPWPPSAQSLCRRLHNIAAPIGPNHGPLLPHSWRPRHFVTRVVVDGVKAVDGAPVPNRRIGYPCPQVPVPVSRRRSHALALTENPRLLPV